MIVLLPLFVARQLPGGDARCGGTARRNCSRLSSATMFAARCLDDGARLHPQLAVAVGVPSAGARARVAAGADVVRLWPRRPRARDVGAGQARPAVVADSRRPRHVRQRSRCWRTFAVAAEPGRRPACSAVRTQLAVAAGAARCRSTGRSPRPRALPRPSLRQREGLAVEHRPRRGSARTRAGAGRGCAAGPSTSANDASATTSIVDSTHHRRHEQRAALVGVSWRLIGPPQLGIGHGDRGRDAGRAVAVAGIARDEADVRSAGGRLGR